MILVVLDHQSLQVSWLIDTKAEQSANIQILRKIFCRLAKLALDAAEMNHETLLLNKILVNILINN